MSKGFYTALFRQGEKGGGGGGGKLLTPIAL